MSSVVWVTGPPGVGKSTAGWTLYGRALARGEAVAFLDVDQVANLQPDPDGDPDRLDLGRHAAAAVVRNLLRAGHGRVIVSGVTDPAAGIATELPDAVLVRLRCDVEELVRRYLGRTGNVQLETSVRQEATAYDASTAADAVIDTTARHPREVIDAIGAVLGPPPAPVGDRPVRAEPAVLPGFLLTGPPGVGLSTIGWALASRSWRRGVRVGFVDVDQLGFTDGRDAAAVAAANLAAVAAAHRDVGATALVAVARGPRVGAYREVLPRLTVVRLVAERAALAARVAARAAGGGPNLAGSELRGLSGPQQLAAVERSLAVSAALEATGHGHRLDTTGLPVDDIVDRIDELAVS